MRHQTMSVEGPLNLNAEYTGVLSSFTAYAILEPVKPWLHSLQGCQEEAQSQSLACKCTDI